MHLGIDLGTSSVKAVLTDGRKIIRDKEKYSGDHTLYLHPAAMVEDAVQKLVKRLTEKTQQPIAGLAIGGHGPSLIFVGNCGEPLTQIVTWQDKQAHREAAELRNVIKGFTRDATSYEAKILWHYRQYPELFASGNSVLYPKDYLVFLLTGQRIMDHSTASTIGFYDEYAQNWSDSNLGFGTEIFPDVIESTGKAGVTGTAFSRSCGLPDGTDVYGGGIDAYCESLGAGAVNPGDTVDGTGTSTCLSVCRRLSESGDRHVLPDRRLEMRTISYSGGSVRWLKNLSYEIRENLKTPNWPDRPSGLVFLPYLTGERSPIWDEQARGVFFGLDSETGILRMGQAVLEGVGYAVRQNLETLSGEENNPVRAVGGGAANEKWLQMKADITGRVYWQMEEPDSGALGAALISAIGSGELTGEEISTWARCRREFRPREQFRKTYDELFGVYSGLYPLLQDSFRRLKDINDQIEQM